MEKKAHRGKMLKIMGNEQFIRGMCEYFTLRRAEAKKILEDAGKARRNSRSEAAGVPFQGDSGARQRNVDLGCGPPMMRKGFIEIKRDGSWEEFKEGCREKRIHQNGPSRKLLPDLTSTPSRR